jgi:Ca2+-dependent lipid-binding protein
VLRDIPTILTGASVPLPIFVELQGLVGTVRLRLQMSPEPPFLKAVTFTLMGLPQVQAGCVPMFETGINVLNLPLISKFVNYAIGKHPIIS